MRLNGCRADYNAVCTPTGLPSFARVERLEGPALSGAAWTATSSALYLRICSRSEAILC